MIINPFIPPFSWVFRPREVDTLPNILRWKSARLNARIKRLGNFCGYGAMTGRMSFKSDSGNYIIPAVVIDPNGIKEEGTSNIWNDSHAAISQNLLNQVHVVTAGMPFWIRRDVEIIENKDGKYCASIRIFPMAKIYKEVP